jgi:threonine/homoserine/homoserine lactone efflux protein
MPLDLWLAFVAASIVLLIIPGPTIALVIGYAMGEGKRAALAIVAGVALGDLTAISLSLVGVGALLAASAELFTVLTWIGAAYLIWLGIRLWRAPVNEEGAAPVAKRSSLTMLGHAWLVTALNPKSILFFVAFLPQFLDPTAPYAHQAVLLVVTFVSLAAINALAYALLAGAAGGAIRRPQVRRTINRAGGGVLIGAGVMALFARR